MEIVAKNDNFVLAETEDEVYQIYRFHYVVNTDEE